MKYLSSRRTRVAAAGGAVAAVLTLAGCMDPTFTFEAVPVGMNEDHVENGVSESELDNGTTCFVIEADNSNDDTQDRQLGGYISVEAAGDPQAVEDCQDRAQAQSDQEAQDD